MFLSNFNRWGQEFCEGHCTALHESQFSSLNLPDSTSRKVSDTRSQEVEVFYCTGVSAKELIFENVY